MTYSVIIKNGDGTLQWDLPFDSFTFTEELNRGKNAQLTFTLSSIKDMADAYGVTVEFILSASYREVEIYDSTGTKIYYGYVSEIQFSKGSGTSPTVSVTSKGFFNLFEKRLTGGNDVFTAQDSADIAWSLINTSQAKTYGGLGITRGVHPATKTRDRTFRYKTIAEAIKKMSSDEVKDGYDFDIDNTKAFNIYYPMGTVRANIYLQEGFNINTYSIFKTFIDGMANSVVVTGAGMDATNQLVVTRNSDNAYKEAFFLLEEALNEGDIIETTTLNDKGDAYLTAYQSPRYTINCTVNYDEPLFTDYEVGDWFNVEIPSFTIDDTYRISKRTCDHLGKVTLTLRGY